MLEYYGLGPAKPAAAAAQPPAEPQEARAETPPPPPDAAAKQVAELGARVGIDPAQVTLQTSEDGLGGGRLGETEAAAGGVAVRLSSAIGSAEEERTVIGHELVHVAQHQLPAEVPAAPRELLEAEAHRLGPRASAGEAVRPVHRADPANTPVLGFDSFEHKALIEMGARTPDGRAREIRLRASRIDVTAGEVGALMKDFFSEWSHLDNCPHERLWPLVQLIRRQSEQAARNGGRPRDSEAAANEREAQQLTAWREEEVYDPKTKTVRQRGEFEGGETKSYLTLAKKNNDHFYEENLKWSMTQIGEALSLLVRAASHPEPERKEMERQAEGLVYASFHGLTDALSTGHMTLGKDMRRAGGQFWHEHRAQILEHLMNALRAHAVWSRFLADRQGQQDHGEILMRYTLRLHMTAVALLLLAPLSCTPKDKGPLFTCKACFRDKPNWCAVYQDGASALADGSEKEAMELAKIDLCSDYEHKTDGGDRAYIRCRDRIEDDFVITCTSRMGYIPRHPGFKAN